MKNLILYFTGTGNSLYIAREIAKELDNTDVASMTMLKKSDEKYERVGIVFPCYAGGLPRFVKEYAEKYLPNFDTDYYFSIETRGGSPSAAHRQVDKMLRKKGKRLKYHSSILMYANYVCLYELAEDINARDNTTNTQLKKAILSVADKNTNNTFPNIFTVIQPAILKKYVLSKGKGLHVNGDCVTCGLCVKICPVNNIILCGNKPQFGDNCEQCVACIQLCPEKAINYLDKTQNRRRYHHPQITAKDLIPNAQNEAVIQT